METQKNHPNTLQEAIIYFADPDNSFEFVKGLRWSDGIVACPHCGSTEHYFIKTRRIWKCKYCKKQFSVKVGTIFEDSPLGLDKWLCAIWLIANAKNGVSSCEIHRALGVTQKTGWFMLQRIRLAMKTGTFKKLAGEVEADETYVGGKAKNMHKHKKEGMKRGRGSGKAIVFGLLERQGRVFAKVVKDVKGATLQGEIRNRVKEGSKVYTDALPSYNGLDDDYGHEVVDHAVKYVVGRVHTNGLENFWSLFKRCIKGTYIALDPAHLERYLDEETFRFNNRTDNDGQRMVKVLKSINGKRLTYKGLIGKVK